MGFWGFAPFQNDYALDEYGGYSTPEHLKGSIWQGIRRGVGHSVDVHEIMGMILRSFKVYDGICREEDEKEMVKAIASKTFTKETADAMSGETPMMIMSCATIDFEERKKMLEYAANKMMGIIEANNTEKVTFKEEPKLLSDYFDADKVENSLFDNDKIWIREAKDEENKAYQEVYNLARKTVNSNFENVTCPMMLLPEHVAWLDKKQKERQNNELLKEFNENYINGISRLNMSGYKLDFNNATLKIVDYIEYYTNRLSNEELGLVEVNVSDFFKTHFTNGFIWHKGRLVSVDKKLPLENEDGKDIVFKPNEVTTIGNYVKIYRTKVEYETEMAKKQKEGTVKPEEVYNGPLRIICVDRKYKGSKIIAYTIKDEHGRINEVDPEYLKNAIKNRHVNCLNMILTSDNRLVPKKINK